MFLAEYVMTSLFALLLVIMNNNSCKIMDAISITISGAIRSDIDIGVIYGSDIVFLSYNIVASGSSSSGLTTKSSTDTLHVINACCTISIHELQLLERNFKIASHLVLSISCHINVSCKVP